MPAGAEHPLRAVALATCRERFPSWHDLADDEVDIADPKGFSSLTFGLRPRRPVDPPAVLYRHLEGKENAILDPAAERRVFLLLGEHDIAAHCHHYDDTCRIESFHRGRSLTREEVFDPVVQRGIADELFRFHQLEPDGLPGATFFELLHEKWGPLARTVLEHRRDEFPPDEQPLCDELAVIHAPATLEKALDRLPDREPVFCHNDTYHGNVMRLDDGRIKLVDFEFSCRNHPAFDFANLFAETVMRHGDPEPPHFHIAEPDYTDADLASLVGFYVDQLGLREPGARERTQRRLVDETRRAIVLSDYMYAMAALPLALEPVQRIRFLPYAHRRFRRFLEAVG